jgi:gliding motility-associated-like protein
MKKLFTLFLGIILSNIAFSQIDFTISDESGDINDEVSIDVRVSNFEDVATFQFSINWDPTIAEFVEIQNISTALPEFNIDVFGDPSLPSIDPGELAVIWNPSNTQDISIAENDHLLFTLVLELVGSECEESIVNMSNTPREIEFTDNNGVVYDVTSDDGTASIDGANCGGSNQIDLNITNESAASGTNQCVSVFVDGFFEIVNAEIGVLWDGDLLENATVTNSSLTGAIVVPMDGTLRMLWQAPNLDMPLTLDDNTKLFDLCYDVIASSGTTACVDIGDITTAPTFETSFSNFDEEIIPYTIDNGCITVQGGSTDVTFYYDDQDIILGSNVCVPVRVRNFNNIASFQYAMEFDTDVLTYTGLANLNTDIGIMESFFGITEPGVLAVFWSDPSTLGLDLDNETILYEVCFDVSGDCDETTEIEFTDNVNEGIEVTNGNVETVPFVFESNVLTIICPCELNLVASQSNDVSCNGGNDGQLTVVADGGNGNYTYSWSNNDSGATIDGLEAATYTVSVTDGESCVTSATFQVDEPNAINIGATIVDESASCNGSISLNVNGGTGSYDYAWSDNGGNTPNRTGLCKGDYDVTVTDENDCSETASYSIAPAPMQIIDVTINDVNCNGGSDGSIELDITGGCEPYTVSPSIVDLSAGNYMITITDASTPPNEIVQSYPVSEPDPIVITLDNIVDTDITINGEVNVTVTGGTEPYSYNWSPNGEATEDISGLGSGTYTLQVTDANGCIATAEQYTVGSSVIMVDVNLADFNGFSNDCAGECNGMLSTEVIASNGDVSYTLDNAAVSLPLMDLCAGDYVLGYTDENGLTGSTAFTITEPDALEISVELISDCSDGDNGEANITVAGGVETYSYEYSGSTEDTSNPVMLEDGTNTVVVTDANGCQVSSQFEIEMCVTDDPDLCYNGSLVLTPNTDGSNDLFVISCLENINNTLYVYDRFGRTVYTQSNYDNTWGGIDSNGNELPENGYMWVLEVISSEGIREVYKGTVTILRNTY